MLDLTTKILRDHLGLDDRSIEPNAMLVEDLGADSLDLVELQMVLEDVGIAAPDNAFPMHMTASDFDKLIAAATPEQRAALA